jgi:hypothetical protein
MRRGLGHKRRACSRRLAPSDRRLEHDAGRGICYSEEIESMLVIPPTFLLGERGSACAQGEFVKFLSI